MSTEPATSTTTRSVALGMPFDHCVASRHSPAPPTHWVVPDEDTGARHSSSIPKYRYTREPLGAWGGDEA